VRWHLLTGEYPPASGGVGDYTAGLARALAAAGDEVVVWVGDSVARDGEQAFTVHALPDRFGPAARATLTAAFDRAPGIVLLQYVPNALGMRGSNVAFCRWLRDRGRRGDDVRVMFHEPYIYFSLGRPWISFLSLAQRLMAATLIEASSRVYFSTDQWHRYLKPHAASQATTLPIPSTITANPDPTLVAQFRERFTAGAGAVVGHFGTYGDDVAAELLPVLVELRNRRPAQRIALIGANGSAFRHRLAAVVDISSVVATDRLVADQAAAALRACDLLAQPYPDGATTRRTSLMAGLSQGVATVTTIGFLTEPLWRKSGAVMLMPAGDPRGFVNAIERLLDCEHDRLALARRGPTAYAQYFSMERTIARLRGAVE
jgi:glycosyltransferase involved in cell wall biosynthesis